ncbi:MAG: efflux RND transporter periplasmic adaptor subunit [Opitutales bacterium]
MKLKLSPLIQGSLQIVLIIVVLVGGVAANFLLTRSHSGPGQSATGPDQLAVEVIRPESLAAPIRLEESGVVRARNNVGLTTQVSGQVIEVSPNLVSGGEFEAGEVLFKLDPADYQADVQQARADVSSAKANLQVERAEAEIAVDEWNLVNPGQPVPDLVARKPQIAQARASLESAQARLSSARLNLERVAFTLPFSGRIIETTVELGQRLSANQTYGQAYALDSLEVSVSIDANMLMALEGAAGREAVIRAGSRGFTREYSGTLSRVEAELDRTTRLGGAIVTFDDPSGVIPGTFVNVEISGPVVEDALIIPELAMLEARYVWFVKEGRLKKQALEILGLHDEGELITAPFDFGEGIIVSPLIDPTESTPVKIINSEAAQ